MTTFMNRGYFQLKKAISKLDNDVQFMCSSFNYQKDECEIHTAFGTPADKDGKFERADDATYFEIACLPGNDTLEQ